MKDSGAQETCRGDLRQTARTKSGPGAAGSARLAQLDDDLLMERAKDGDEEAYAIVVRRYSRLVVFCSASQLADLDAGWDVAQDVFLSLWANRARYVPKGKLAGYVATLARNRCRDLLRRQGHETRLRERQAGEAPIHPPACEWVMLKQSVKQLHFALSKLDADERDLLVMRYGLELPYDEIAEQTGRSAGTLRSQVFYALRKLRKLLERTR